MTPDSATRDGRDRLGAPADLNQALLDAGPDLTGTVWKLTEPGRQLDANLVRLSPGDQIPAHTEDDVDVLLVVTAGSGTLETPAGSQRLIPSSATLLPVGVCRSISAGPDGLAYLTVHRARTGGLRIRLPRGEEEEEEGGEGACQLARVCPDCGQFADTARPTACANCGAVMNT